MAKREILFTDRATRCSDILGVAFLAIFVVFASVNIITLVYLTPALTGPTVKGLKVSQDGSLVVNVAGLVAPARPPTDNFMADVVVYNNPTKFNINPKDICTGKTTELLVAVSSNAINIDRRRRTRATFNVGPQRSKKVRLVFFLSTYPTLPGLQGKIMTESSIYRDIVQLRAMEAYRNLTLKSVAILYWATTFCPRATYVLKQDDDVKLHVPDVVRALREKSMQFEHFIVGNSKILVESPIRDELSKYYTSPEEFGEPHYPVFAHGPGYAFPLATAALLYQASLRTRHFWLEDVYVTGLCAAKVGVPVFFDQRLVLNEDWGNSL